MRTPVNPIPFGARIRWPSVAASFIAEVFQLQPGSSGAGGTTPLGTLDVVSGRLTDDASRNVARTMALQVGRFPSWLQAGMWIRGTVGIQTVQPIIYRLPCLIITDLAETKGGVEVTAEDPGTVLNGDPLTADTTLTSVAANLQALATWACSTLTRVPDVSKVPALTLPAGMSKEFGVGKWDLCLSTADSLGVALRFTDPGDVVGTIRANPPPSPAAVVDRCHSLTDSGARHHVRAPTVAKVFVGRGGSTVGLIGSATSQAITGSPPPSWYLPYTITDRVDSDPATTQAQADQLATDLMRSRLSELDAYQDMPILPAPWLEAGVDVVTYLGLSYAVRAITFELPSLATAVTLRRIL